MSSSSSGGSSSRSSTEDFRVGLLDEKRGLHHDEETGWRGSSLKHLSPSWCFVTWLCFPLRLLSRSLGPLLELVLPSFLQPRAQDGRGQKEEPLPPTAFLDGMRGLAAFIVFFCHLTYGTFDLTHSWGAKPDPENRPFQNDDVNKNFLRLPIVRLLYSGPPMVAIFFVVSGYALSYKPLKLMRSRKQEQFMMNMCSSIFRRGLRLFLPCFASTFLVICLAQLNLYKITEDFARQTRTLREDHCYTQPNPWLQLTDWLQQMLIFVDVFDWSLYAGSIELDRHLWTIPTEFRCSMALFLTHMLVARMTTRLRISTLTVLVIWGVSQDRWELCPFWAGAMIAELDIIHISKSSDLPTSLSSKTTRSFASKIFYALTFLCSLFLLSYPDAAGHASPGYVTLTYFIPTMFTQKHRFWPTVGAILIVWTSSRSKFLRQRVFCWAPVQYLGKISFPLYVVHGPVIHTLGYLILPRTPEVETPEVMYQFELDFMKTSIVITIVVIWAADIFLTMVDTPCVNLARKIEKRFFAP